jgi:hypothetical protein
MCLRTLVEPIAQSIPEHVALAHDAPAPCPLADIRIDEAQGTAIFVGYFETEQKMRDASALFEQMDPSETPGTRASVDLCEVKVQRTTS